MRLALVVNPSSGADDGGHRVARALRGHGADVAVTAIDQLEGAADLPVPAPDRLVVAGGDGSIGLVARLAADLGVPLAVVPVGTANDFARARGLPADVDEACALAADPAARTAHAELARVGDRPFVNAASVGLSVDAARAAHPHKGRLGPLAYAVGALRAGARSSPVHVAVSADGEQRFAGDAWQVTVGVTGAFGGGSEIGGTETGDEQLDVAIVPAGPRLALARRALAMRLGRLTAQHDVVHLRGRAMEVQLAEPRPFNVDGEVCECRPPRFEIVDGGFEVVVA